MRCNVLFPKAMTALAGIVMTSLLVACSDGHYNTPLPANLTQHSTDYNRAYYVLTPEEQALLNRYILRRKLSKSYDMGALESRITIKDALSQQRIYEKNHQHDPTGKIAYLKEKNGISDNKRLSANLLRLKPNDNQVMSNKVEMQLILSNFYDKPVAAVDATLHVIARDNETQYLSLPIKRQFKNVIAPDDSMKLRLQVDFASPVIVKAIKDTHAVSTRITAANVTFADQTSARW